MFRRYVSPLYLATTLALALFIAGCSSDGDGASGGEAGAAPAAAAADVSGDDSPYTLQQTFDLNIEVTSPVFSRIRRIPKEHSCGTRGKTLGRTYDQNYVFGAVYSNTSPPLNWTGVPEGTVSIAMIMESDQVRGESWSHWVIWNIPGDATGLAAAVATTTEVRAIGPSARQGVNDYKTIGYSGPCPVPVTVIDGQAKVKIVFEYFFRVYALDVMLELGPDISNNQLLRAIEGHIIGGGEIKGEFVASVIKAS